MKQTIISSLIKRNLIPGNSPILAEIVFEDLLKVLRFIHSASKNGDLTENFLFTDQISYLDEIWHEFILHTKLYYTYCINEYGEVIHHTPEIDDLPKAENRETNFSNICRRQMNLLSVYEGSEFMAKIFFHYPLIFKIGTSNA